MGHPRSRGQAWLACLLTAVAVVVVAPVSVQAQVADKQREAEAVRARLTEQGRKLSIADEQYNRARIERQRIDTQAASTRDLVAASEARWTGLREQLGSRVRLLYMHPGAAIDAWLGAKSVTDLARAKKLGSAVLTADNELVMETERARQDVVARAKRLEAIRDNAERKERELASHRTEVSEAVSSQRSLLNNVTSDIAAIMEEQHQRELARAPEIAPEAQDDDPPVIRGGESRPADTADEEEENEPAAATPRPTAQPKPEEPTSAPPVKGGAAKAVATAAAQIGKPYEWAADGPDTFDCSGLTMYAWASAGVSLPHSSQAQYASFPKVSRSQLRPGDLVFYGSPIHHVGIYEGGGVYINAPETGEFVRRNSIDRSDWAGAARP